MVNQDYETFAQSNVGQIISDFTKANGKPCFTVTKAAIPVNATSYRFNLTFHLVDPKADTTSLLEALGTEGLVAYNSAMTEVSSQVLQGLRNDPIISHQLGEIIASYNHQEPSDAALRALEDELNAILRTELAMAIINQRAKAMTGK